MRIRNYFWSIAIPLLLATPAMAQLSIRGWVADEQTGEAMPGASVFLANTTYGTITDAKGEFILSGLKQGHFKMVVSFISYQTKVVEVEVDYSKTAFYNVKLRPAAKELNAVVVNAGGSRLDWLINYRIFKDNFIGVSDNAKNCQIRNRNVLHFNNNNGVLKATADSMLIIDNVGLGYRLKFLIGKYEYNTNTKRLYYDGQVMYEALEPADEKQKDIWDQRRLKAYQGSLMHFLRSLYQRRLVEEGFYFNLITTKFNKNGKAIRTGIADTLIKVRSGPLRRNLIGTINKYHRVIDSTSMILDDVVLDYNGDLEVKYVNEVPSFDYQAARMGTVGNVIPQTSLLRLLKPCPLIDPLGQVYPQDGTETTGYWSWELVAESLPYDFDPNPVNHP